MIWWSGPTSKQMWSRKYFGGFLPWRKIEDNKKKGETAELLCFYVFVHFNTCPPKASVKVITLKGGDWGVLLYIAMQFSIFDQGLGAGWFFANTSTEFTLAPEEICRTDTELNFKHRHRSRTSTGSKCPHHLAPAPHRYRHYAPGFDLDKIQSNICFSSIQTQDILYKTYRQASLYKIFEQNWANFSIEWQ